MTARESFLSARLSGIGGSDAAAILGLSRYKTPLAVYQEKRGEAAPQDDNEAMLWGRVLEPVIRQQYAERTGRTVRIPDNLIRHGSHDWMIANLDGMTDDGRVIEIKTARVAAGWGEPGTDEVPHEYLLQVQHYMAVTGFPVADIAVLIGGSDFRLYEIHADHELQSLLIHEEGLFWQCVERGEPPEPMSLADCQARFGRASREAAVEAAPEVLRALNRLREIKTGIDLLEAEADDQKAIVLKALGESDTLVSAGVTLATWKAAAGAKRFDAAAFKSVFPEMYAQFVKTGEPSRRFLIK